MVAFALMLFGSVRLQADAVSPEQAKQIASQFINQRSALGAPSSQRHAPSQSAMTEMIDGIVSTTEIFPAGYLDLKPEDIKQILKESL